MELFLFGSGATLAVLMLILTVLTRGKIWLFVWFLLVCGIYKIFGRNPLG